MAERLIIFDANSLLKLITHYTMDHEEQIPLDAELRSAGVSTMIGRWVILEVEAKEWDGGEIDPITMEPPMMHVRFEGNKVMSWKQGKETHTKDSWRDAVESPA